VTGTGANGTGANEVQELERLLAANQAQERALVEQLDRVVAASEQSNADDEHDPEGATIAFERQQAAALLEQVRRTGADLRRALDGVRDGSYGTCERCGGPVGAERLAARPQARTCIDCARLAGRRA
jgi:DnaK suppressor protein